MLTTGIPGRSSSSPASASPAHPLGGEGLTVPQEAARVLGPGCHWQGSSGTVIHLDACRDASEQLRHAAGVTQPWKGCVRQESAKKP